MKRGMLWLALLLLAACAVGSAAGHSTISWTQASGVCAVSDAYYITEDGRKAFIAGGLTAVPGGAEVFMTIAPIAADDAIMRLDPDGYMDMGGGRTVPLECAQLHSADTGEGVYHFVMPDGDGVARLTMAVTRVYGISAAQTLPGGALSITDASGRTVAYAAEGEQLSVQYAPDAQHVLNGSALSITAADGSAVAVRRGADGAAFDMPAGDVSIAAEFAPAAAIELTDGLTCSIQGDAAATTPLRAMPGSEVVLTVSPDGDGMRIRTGSWRVTANGAPVECEFEQADDVSGAFRCSFVMPDEAVCVEAGADTAHRARCKADIKLLRADGTAATAYCAGEQLYVTVRVPEGKGLIDDRLTITADSGYARQTVVGRDGNELTFMITAPAGDMAISAEYGQLHSIICAQPQGLGVVQTYPACNAAAGSRVTVALLPAQGWRVGGDVRICRPGTSIETAAAQSGSFIMPDGDCEISAAFEPELFDVMTGGHECFLLYTDYSMSALGAVEAPAQGGVPCGALVNVRAVATGDCRVQGIYMQPMAASSVQHIQVGQGEQAAFVMPAHDVLLYAVCADEAHAPDAAGAAEQTAPDAADVPYAATVATDRLRLRESPDTGADVAGTYSTGERVTVTGLSEDGEWAHVTIDGDDNAGWMKLEFLIAAGAQQPAAETPELNITIVIPAIEPQVVGAVEQQEENSTGRYQFKHILFL